MEVVAAGLFAPIIVLFIVLMAGERIVSAFVVVVAFVWGLLT